MDASVPLAVRIRKGLHFFFFDDTIDERLMSIMMQAVIVIGIASFFLFFYLTFIHGWGSYEPWNRCVVNCTGVP